MDTLSKVLNLVKTGDWAISLDLKDAYLHVPIFHTHRKYLRFCIQNQCYQFKVLCFGPTSAPRVFTKIVSVVAAYLRTLGIRLADCKSEQKAVIIRSRELSQSPEIFRFSGKQRKIDSNWTGLMNRRAFGIICKHEAIMPKRCRNMKADAFSWVKRFSIARFNLTILSSGIN
jgi:hypothetical protein